MAILNTSQSIIDYFKSKGLTSDYSSRQKLYSQMGLSGKYGEYTGSETQNPAFLQELTNMERSAGTQLSPTTILNMVQGGYNKPVSTTPKAGDTQESNGKQYILGNDGQWREQPTITPTDTGDGQLPDDVLKSILGYTPSADELATKAQESLFGSAEYNLTKEGIEAEKAKTLVQQQADKEKFISELASRGLGFSGKKDVGLATIDAETLAQTLGIDRKFALYVAQGLQSSAQDIAKEAQKGNPTALASLRSLGYDINPLTGTVEKTLSARTEERIANTDKSAANNVITTANGRRVIVDKATGKVIADLGASTTGSTGTGSKLSAQEALKWNLPQSMVGRSETDIFTELQSPQPPLWYLNSLGIYPDRQSYNPTASQKKWETFRQGILNNIKKTPPASMTATDDIKDWFSVQKDVYGLDKDAAEQSFLDAQGLDELPEGIKTILDEVYG